MKGKPKKETAKDKRERRKDNVQIKHQLFTIVIPVLLLVAAIVIGLVYLKTRPKLQM
jgi:hypothetical protein